MSRWSTSYSFSSFGMHDFPFNVLGDVITFFFCVLERFNCFEDAELFGIHVFALNRRLRIQWLERCYSTSTSMLKCVVTKFIMTNLLFTPDPSHRRIVPVSLLAAFLDSRVFLVQKLSVATIGTMTQSRDGR